MSKVNVWWPMYPADFTIDTAHLTNEEVGAYVKLLNAAWRQDGSISSDQKQLARLVGVSPQKWKKMSESLRPLFTEKAGKWLNVWLSKELDKAKANSVKKSQNAKKRWHGRSEMGMQMHSKSNASASDEAMHMQCPSPSPSPSPSPISTSVRGAGSALEDEPIETNFAEVAR
ncbi:MAG: YdaU family protein [Candidatus Thiodiazotropha sp. (ex Lucinoma borealis)]|nr:YdaU family protein [Candidatus Thiodiazotropha sp. (ex Lucinoma borealis)]MCU7866289.1 YdaU family protein [Candidatus Thiodiazotropha sp. (ex Lucinoma borealis)]MCU7868237.1 YdaU family protein [Candidatus Thiodiazotropha sp. (ex Lucinoma borealis)]